MIAIHARSISSIFALGLFAAAAVKAAGPALFVFQPLTVSPGGVLTVSGSRFNQSDAAVAITIVSTTGQATPLGIAGLLNGQFQTSVRVPASMAGGRYFINVATSTSSIALNLTGSPVVTPNVPWFTFSPLTALPRGAITFSGGGFKPDSTAVGIVALDSNNKATTLGFASLKAGGFSSTLTLPSTLLPQTSYRIFAKDSGTDFAANTAGPLTIVNAPGGITAPLGLYPIGAAVDPASNRVFLPNAGDNTVSVLDGNTNQVIATVPVGPLPCAIGINPTAGFVYVANANGNSVSVLNIRTGTVVATVPVGAFPCAVAVVPQTGRVYVGNSGGTDVSVIDGGSNSVIATIPVGKAPWGIAAHPGTHRVYAAIVDGNSVAVIDGDANTVLANVSTQGANPDAVGINTATNQVYIANYFSDNVSVLDGNTNRITAVVPTGRQPSGVAANASTGNVYVCNYASGTVTVINSANSVLANIAAGLIPNGVAINQNTNMVYVPNSDSLTVSIIQDNR